MMGGIRSHEFARYLAAQGHDVTIIASWQSESAPPTKTEHVDGYSLHWLHVPYSNSMGYRRRLFAFSKFMVLASWHGCRLPADLVFATSTPLTVVIPGALASWVRRVPWILEIRDLWPEVPIALGALRNPLAQWLARCLERFGYRTASHLIALSPGMKDGILRAGVPASRITVIPNLSDLDRFGPESCDPERFLQLHPQLQGRPIVLYAGTFGRVNGLGYVIQIAAEALKDPGDVAFCVVGDGFERDGLLAQAASAGVLGRNFFVCSPVPKQCLPDVLAASEVCLSFVVDVPELWNNSANKFFDALAAGKPLVINHEGWQADLIRRHDVGVVLPPSDASRAWAMLSKFLACRDRVAGAGRRARQLAESSFNKSHLCAQFETVLRASISAKESARRVSEPGVL